MTHSIGTQILGSLALLLLEKVNGYVSYCVYYYAKSIDTWTETKAMK